jgi:hypothetical protein
MWRGTTWALTSTLMFVTALLATIGFLLRLRHVSVLETFVVAYVGLLVVFPFSANRYLLPIIPFILMYGMIGLVFIADRGGVAVKAVAIALAVLVGITYVANVVLVDRSPFLTGVTSANARAGFHYLRECTPTDAIILSRRPRAVALFTRRDAMTAGRRQLLDRAAYQSFVQSAGIDYVAAFNNSRMDLATAALPELFTRVFQNNQWVIYRYDPGDGVRGTRSSNACSPT